MTSSSRGSVPMGIIAIALVVAVGAGLFFYNSGSEKAMDATTQTSMETSVDSGEKMENSMEKDSDSMEKEESFKDGNYSAMGKYTSPGGPEEIKVNVTLKDGVITEASVEPQAKLPKSITFQKMFADNFKPMVVGKKVADLKLEKVSGSSLTPIGFNDAIDQIEDQAEQKS